jgi:hypothetical protein
LGGVLVFHVKQKAILVKVRTAADLAGPFHASLFVDFFIERADNSLPLLKLFLSKKRNYVYFSKLFRKKAVLLFTGNYVFHYQLILDELPPKFIVII